MRFHLGPPPPNTEFNPANGTWVKLKEPNPWVLQLLALPIAAVTGLLLVWAVSSLGDLRDSGIGPIIAVLLLLVPVHESIHALTHPGNGRSAYSVMGVWPSRLLFYAHYDGPISRNRFLAVLILPFLALTITPLLAEVVLRMNLDWLAALIVINGLAASGDLLGCLLVLCQVPATATVRNQGYYTWWQPTTLPRR